jgi:DNA-binding transcriptional LysR family regulator
LNCITVYFLETIKMDINDLRSFLVVAQQSNLRSAAESLHQSPSAISKAIRRLESSLNTAVFDRVGKSIRLNAHGAHLRQRALQLVALADQTQAEFRGDSQHLQCRIAGPALLQWRYAPGLSTLFGTQHPAAGLVFVSLYEDAALAALARGEADFALVTGAAVNATLPAGLEAIALGSITMQLAAGRSHPLVTAAPASRRRAKHIDTRTAQVLAHAFACPDRSLFCGLDRGTRSDGWRDDRLPRRIRFWLEDLQLLVALVRSGQALAYLPDFALDDPELMRLCVSDCPYTCVEETFLVWRPDSASGWQGRLVRALPTTLARLSKRSA